jgi:hypothetical protein
MLRGLWNRIVGRTSEELIEREKEREQMSPAERHRIGESVYDIQADSFVGEHLGGVPGDELAGEEEPPHDRYT